jgi:pimeloyl-ACP methyl ester carboxylesterase
MPQIKANGIAIEYASYGPRDGETILLIMGLGAQMTRWPPALIEMFNARGFGVVTFDNRDVGLSHKFDEAGPADIAAIMAERAAGKTPAAAYTLDDMAKDAAGVLDALDIERAHIVGASMGGMIAQMVAANPAHKTSSLTSIMSSTGNPGLPPAKPEAMAILMTRPVSDDVDILASQSVKSQKIIGSPAYPADDGEIRARFLADYRRAYYPVGVTRQMAAVMASGDRRNALRGIAVPTMVVHGTADPLVPIEGGRDTAAVIAGAELREIPGMGHDLPAALIPTIVDAVETVARKARVSA